MEPRERKFQYKWVILTVSALMMFVCLGFCSGNKGMYLAAITDALNIPRSLFSINDSLRYVASALGNLFIGTIMARLGVRKTAGLGFAALLASMLLYARAESIFVFYIGGFLLGLGFALTGTAVVSRVILNWFKADMGKYMGIVLAANGVGGAIAAQIISPLINNPDDPFGYRDSYLLVAGIVALTGILTVALLRERPRGEAPLDPAQHKKKVRGTRWRGIDLKTARRRPYFYAAGACVLMTGFLLQSVGGVYIAHMKDVGLAPEFTANVASVALLCLAGSKMLVGALYDRFGLRPIMVICPGMIIAAFLLLTFLDNSSTGQVCAMLMAICYAIGLPLETLVVPLITNELFGSASYDHILGILLAMNYTGYALGAPLINLFYDVFGSYRMVFPVFSVIMLIIAIVFQFIITAARKERRAQAAAPAGSGD